MYTKLNPFMQIKEAFVGLTDSSTFYTLRKQSLGSKIVYAILISILSCFLLYGLVAFKITTNKDLNQFLNSLPEFSYTNGELFLSERYEFQKDDAYFVIDTEQAYWDINRASLIKDASGTVNTQSYHPGSETDINTYIQKSLENSSVSRLILVSKSNIILIYPKRLEYQSITMAEFMNTLNITSLSKLQLLSDYKGFVFQIILILALITIPFQAINLFWAALIYGAISLMVNAALHKKEKFATLYWISFYMLGIIAIVQSIITPLIPLLLFPLASIGIILFFIIIMFNTLRAGDPAMQTTVISDSSLNDDLDAFLQTETPSTVASAIPQSAFSAVETTETSYGQVKEEQPKKSGLSLKMDD